jgi:hydroxymethylpyrimidine pyrophosphatase-like HAD family hydrolase
MVLVMNTDANHQATSPYNNSTLYNKLKDKQIKKLAFFDLDATLTGDIDLANKTRRLLEGHAFAIVYVTTRTEEMVMSQSLYERSIALKTFSRKKPKFGTAQGRFHYIPPENHEPLGLLNPDAIIGSTGTQILLLNEDHYIIDKTYEQHFAKVKDWRKKTRELLTWIDPQNKLFQLPVIDFPDMYDKALADVAPPKYRVGLQFKTNAEKKMFMEKLTHIAEDASAPDELREHAANVSVINDSYPKAQHFKVYIVPAKTNKLHAVNHLLKSLSTALDVSLENFEIILAGDSLPDLAMGIHAGRSTKATFILSGGSRLSDVIADKNDHVFAGEDLSTIKNRLKRITEGHYRYTEPGFERTVIVTDHYSEKIAVASIYEALEQYFGVH